MNSLKLATADRLSIPCDDGGEGAYHTVTAWLAPIDWSPLDIDAAVGEMMPKERCSHSHDCCGHYYAARGRVVYRTHCTDDQGVRCQLVYVHRTYTQNV